MCDECVERVYRILYTIVCDVFVRVCGKGAILRQFVHFFCFVFVCIISNDALFALIALIRPIAAYALWPNAKNIKQKALTHTTNGITHFSVIVIVVVDAVAVAVVLP